MLLIDTNTLYYAIGLSIHNSVDRNTIEHAIDEADEVGISSISFAEIISKYKDNAEVINSICSYLIDHQIKICCSEHIPFKDDIVQKLLTINQAGLDKLFKTLSVLKTTVESPFATVVFFIVLFSETIFECNIDPYNVPSCIFEFFSIIFKDSLGKIIPPLFKTEYQKAYSTDDPEDYIRKVFYNHLQLFISLCIPLCKHTIEEYDKLAIGEILDIPTITNNYSETNWLAEMEKYQAKIAKLQTPALFVKNRGLQYGKSINDKHLEALLSGLNTSLEKTIGTTPIKEYLYSIVSNTISNGGAFRKNDINDALILCDLSSSDVILTFDRRMIEHMENHSTARAEYRNSISYIKSIWPYSK